MIWRESLMSVERIRPFSQFYIYYLGEHRDPRCRLLHYVGSWLVIGAIAGATATGRPWLLIGAPIAGYGSAWIGHFMFEKNRPATFRQPWFSLAGDWLLFWQITIGRAAINERRPSK